MPIRNRNVSHKTAPCRSGEIGISQYVDIEERYDEYFSESAVIAVRHGAWSKWFTAKTC